MSLVCEPLKLIKVREKLVRINKNSNSICMYKNMIHHCCAIIQLYMLILCVFSINCGTLRSQKCENRMYAENAFSDYRFMLFCKSACGHLTVEEFCDKIIEHRVWCCWEDVEYISYWEFMKGRPGLSVKPLNRVSLCNERYIDGEMEITCVQTEQDPKK